MYQFINIQILPLSLIVDFGNPLARRFLQLAGSIKSVCATTIEWPEFGSLNMVVE